MRGFAVLLLLALASTSLHAETKQRVKEDHPATTTPAMAAYRDKLDSFFLKNGIDISVTVRTKCERYDGIAGTPSACPALSFLTNYIDRPTVYALVTGALNSFAEARAIGFNNVVIYGLNPRSSRHTFDLRKPPPICSVDLCF